MIARRGGTGFVMVLLCLNCFLFGKSASALCLNLFHITKDCSEGACPDEGSGCTTFILPIGSCTYTVKTCDGWDGDCVTVYCSGDGCLELSCYHNSEVCSGSPDGGSVSQCGGECWYAGSDCESIKVCNTDPQYNPKPCQCHT